MGSVGGSVTSVDAYGKHLRVLTSLTKRLRVLIVTIPLHWGINNFQKPSYRSMKSELGKCDLQQIPIFMGYYVTYLHFVV